MGTMTTASWVAVFVMAILFAVLWGWALWCDTKALRCPRCGEQRYLRLITRSANDECWECEVLHCGHVWWVDAPTRHMDLTSDHMP